MRPTTALRWIAVTVFIFSSVLNYLDRFVLATMVDIWRSKPEFPFSYSDYGAILSVFGITYALSAPFMGIFIDRVGLNRGISISVALWSLISMAHGWVHNFQQLLICRAALGAAEASGISAAGKVGGMYLLPKERAVGAAMTQLGLSLGAGVAPAFTVYFAYQHNWRWAFFAAGALGLLWIPIWWLTARSIPPLETPSAGARLQAATARDPRLWALVVANFLGMTLYMLWTNWAPTYLVNVYRLTPPQASHYSWAVPLCGYLGAFAGGSLSWRLISHAKLSAVKARKRVCLMAASVLVFSAAIPLLPTPLWATVGMSLSYFTIAAWSTNLYTLPVDIFGAGQAAFSVSALVFAYGAMQAVVSKPVGRVIEHYGFAPVLWTFAFLPLVAYLVVAVVVREGETEPRTVASGA
jgi:ACS family hexuronate transporter-like MFS transporter